MWYDTITKMDRLGIDYGAAVNRALKGETDDVLSFVRLYVHLDGGACYGHGIAMLHVALEIGDGNFADCLSKLTLSERESLWGFMMCGFSHNEDGYRGEQYPTLLPKTYEVLEAAVNKSMERAH